MGTISVIIPVYNTEQYIAKCLDSLMEQTYKDIEILLINDNSNEECTELLEKVAEKDDRIKLFHFNQRMGVGAARNLGVKKASGEFIYFLDSDDYIPSRTLEILINNIKSNDLIRGRIRATNFNSGLAIVFDGLFKTISYENNKFNLARFNSTLNFLFKKEFIERLIKGDTSEVEYEEKSIYNKDGRIKDIPLLPINSINKFELNVPVAITMINKDIRIQTPLNYLYLF